MNHPRERVVCRSAACEKFLKSIEFASHLAMPIQKVESPESIIPRKRATAPGEVAEKGLITLPGEAEREVEDFGGGAYLTTKLDTLVNWARGNSLWPLPFGTACCAIEFMSMVSSHYDISRVGAEVVRFSPRQADLLIVDGTIVDKIAPVMKKIYEQMPEPKY